MKLRDLQSTFAGGEFSPALWGRVDISKYKTGARAIRNMNVLPQGGLRNRPGTKYVAAAGDSSSAVRLIPFVVSTSVTYVIELGDQYARFYTNDAQVTVSAASAWISAGHAYVIGDFVSNSGTIYYCIANNASGATFAADLALGYWRAQTAYEIPTPWAAADIFALKFSQSVDQMFFAHSSYAPEVLTFTSSTSWAIAAYSFLNGPFMVENSDTTSTITPSALSGSITLAASNAIFNANQVGGLFQIVATVVGQTITASLSSAPTNWTTTGSTWQAVLTGTWTGTILIQTSPDYITWTTVQTVSANGTYSGSTGFTTFGYLRGIMQSALSFTGSATCALTGNGSTAVATALGVLNANTPSAACGTNATITITGVWVGTVALQKSTDAGATWANIATYTTNQAATVQATAETNCLIRAVMTAYTSGTATATVDGTAATVPKQSCTISHASVSQAIQAGTTWSVITGATWTGKLLVQVSVDAGANWTIVQTMQSAGSDNYNISGSTGYSQCLVRVITDSSTTWVSTATIDLTASSFDWVATVQITAFSSTTSVTATVLSQSNLSNTGLANTSATWQWSEGSWSTYRGWPATVTFYQDRLCWGSTPSEVQTIWLSQTASYTNFGVSSPLVASDGFSVVLPGRQLNAIQNLVVMPQFLVALTSDSEWAISPINGSFSAESVQTELQGHRGSAAIDPVVVGIELLLIQQMGTVVRNLIFQLAVNGFFGDNISIVSQHLFTGYTIAQMAYQQEPDSIVWLIRSDGKLLSCTYLRDQEMQAWSRHDTFGGLFESVCSIPNPTLGINEVWFVVNRGGTRCIEVLKPRDQGTTPADQWFVDCGGQYSSTATNVVSGLPAVLEGQSLTILADGNEVANPNIPGLASVVVSGGQITLPNSMTASKITYGLGIVWDVGTLDVEAQNNKGTMQGLRVKQTRAKIRVWNSRGGYISTTDPAADTGLTDINGQSFDPLGDIMNRDPSTDMDTPLPLVTSGMNGVGLVDAPLPSGYSYGAHICLRGVSAVPFALLDIVAGTSPGGD